ncbi:hypothetical protein FHX49_001755 [Microbacterium endophyticum]|uniref:Uncharacterized protein n=1 Tax=Microbacterium endophyticum TaxID=1526412 RepID=A0A7W4V3J4_9MICO|nr:hypothetical protein [Microbacterium endophyticum]MBB2976185.1 hypothetical protein [Microbacterium endophyticum]NIK36482.1 hypothetical protein [Microbacterium endophyticum]
MFRDLSGWHALIVLDVVRHSTADSPRHATPAEFTARDVFDLTLKIG